MSQSWDPQHPVDRKLATDLIGTQFPDVDLTSLTYEGCGWDNFVWRCGDIVFRFPHQTEAMQLIEHEWRVLPHVAGLLDMPVPEPLFRSNPTTEYPFVFVGYRWIPEQLPIGLHLTTEERCRAAAPLARFARALHNIPVAQAVGWGAPNNLERGDMGIRLEYATVRAGQLSDTPHAALAGKAVEAMTPPPPEIAETQLRFTHGDVHASQMLFNAQHNVVGMIDWGNVGIGDPAYDLQIAHSFIPPEGRARFWEVYGPVGEGPRARARFIALSYGLAILVNALETDNGPLRTETLFSLQNALSPTQPTPSI
jgi:aminoglycoside phosphotransferase (APT) family kinase protein